MNLPQHVAAYLICFAIGSILGLIPIWIVEVLENTNDSLSATIVAIGREMNWVVVVSGAYSFASVEGFTMLAEIFIKRRAEKALERGREEGIEEGIVKGRGEERRRLVSRLASMTPEERQAELDRLIAEDEREHRNGS